MRVIKKIQNKDREATRIPISKSDVEQCSYAASDEVRKIALPTMEGIQFEPVQQIISLEAQGNYTTLYFTEGRQLLVCKTLMELEQILNNSFQFVRIHRSFIINLNRIIKYVRGKGGYVVMDDGTSRTVSNGKRDDFFAAVKRYFG